MRELTYGEEAWMVNHLSRGLQQLGLDITPRSVERELARMRDMLHETGEGTPDPHAKWMVKWIRFGFQHLKNMAQRSASARPRPMLRCAGGGYVVTAVRDCADAPPDMRAALLSLQSEGRVRFTATMPEDAAPNSVPAPPSMADAIRRQRS